MYIYMYVYIYVLYMYAIIYVCHYIIYICLVSLVFWVGHQKNNYNLWECSPDHLVNRMCCGMMNTGRHAHKFQSSQLWRYHRYPPSHRANLVSSIVPSEYALHYISQPWNMLKNKQNPSWSPPLLHIPVMFFLGPNSEPSSSAAPPSWVMVTPEPGCFRLQNEHIICMRVRRVAWKTPNILHLQKVYSTMIPVGMDVLRVLDIPNTPIYLGDLSSSKDSFTTWSFGQAQQILSSAKS